MSSLYISIIFLVLHKNMLWVLIIIIMIIMITLFQEDNIFVVSASLIYGPLIQIHTCVR